jgi:hypothetical protein
MISKGVQNSPDSNNLLFLLNRTVDHVGESFQGQAVDSVVSNLEEWIYPQFFEALFNCLVKGSA